MGNSGWIVQRQGLIQKGHLHATQGFAIIHSLAGIHGFVVDQHNPQLEADLPFFKLCKANDLPHKYHRLLFHLVLPFVKNHHVVFSLDDYVESGRLNVKQSDVLKTLIEQRSNILVCGGPGSGKTTVTNALIFEAVKSDENQRIFILEDVPELQCKASKCGCDVNKRHG